MIDRYALPEIRSIWSDENRYRKWLDVELAVCEVQAENGIIPKADWETIRSKARFDARRIAEIEETVQHDVIAFLTSVAENVGPASRYIHEGMTSSDVLDTALSLQMKEAGRLIVDAATAFRAVLARRAVEFKDTVCMGRSHGIHAEPTTFGLKLALWHEEMGRNLGRLNQAIETINVGKISGAVGTFAHLDPSVEEAVMKKLGLRPAPVSTQVLQRDRHAEYLAALAITAATLEKVALEIRHLQRTEVREAEEFFSKGQKGSSSMPHKRNPIVCERICGLARIIRSNALTGMENVALWHERDISHSSVERMILPDSTMILYYMLRKATGLIDALLVYPQNMAGNMEKTKGLFFSQSVLLALVRGGLTREDAYKLVQRVSMECWKSGQDFKTAVEQDADIRCRLSDKELQGCFDMHVQLRNVNRIFQRAGLLP
jgi:adenylosuccinate lyase